MTESDPAYDVVEDESDFGMSLNGQPIEVEDKGGTDNDGGIDNLPLAHDHIPLHCQWPLLRRDA